MRQGEEGFMEFYARWPRKIARADALKAWIQTHAVRPPLLDLLAAVDQLMVYRTQLAARRDFVPTLPYPATWLRGQRWEDEFDAPAVTASVPREADAQWAVVREALRRDDPRSLTDHRTRHAIGSIGWSTLMSMRADQALFYGREFERHFNGAPQVQRAQVHVLQPRKVANG